MQTSRKQAGSIILAALMMTLITGALVGLFLQTVAKEIQNTQRYTLGLAAINLAEAGLEYALQATLREGWADWTTTTSGSQTRRFRDTFPDITSNAGVRTRSLKVYVQSESGIADIIIAEGTISLNNGITVSRQVGIEVETTSQRFWVNAILGRKELEFEGNQTYLDSFSSENFDPIANPNVTIADYYNDLRVAAPATILGHDFVNGNAGIASLALTIGAIEIGNADVYGSLATGAPQGSNINSMVGPNGSLYNQDSEYGVNIGGNDSIDESYVSYEFYAELPIPEPPEINNPNSTDPGNTIGAPNTSSAYQYSDFSVSNNSTKTIEGTVEILVDDDVDIDGTLVINGTTKFVITDKLLVGGEITLGPDANVEFFVGGDVDIGGNGVVNLYKPENLLIYSTNTQPDATDVRIRGNASFSGAVYAPNSEIEVRGGVDVFGSLVGYEVEFKGNVSFHYDEALAGTSNSWTEDSSQVIGWRELTSPIDMGTIMANGYSW